MALSKFYLYKASSFCILNKTYQNHRLEEISEGNSCLRRQDEIHCHEGDEGDRHIYSKILILKYFLSLFERFNYKKKA